MKGLSNFKSHLYVDTYKHVDETIHKEIPKGKLLNL
jgi:hypothetical protein